MTHNFLVCYDIANPKRLRKIYTLLRAYGEHMQRSVFFCTLSKEVSEILKQHIQEIIHNDEDQVLYIPCKSRDSFQTQGKELAEVEDLIYII